MKRFNRISAVLLTVLLSSSVMAAEKSKHTLGFQVGAGGLEYNNQDTDNEGMASSYLYYNYKLSQNYYLEVGATGAEDIDDWDCDKNNSGDWECFSDGSKLDLIADDFDYKALVIALKTDLSLSKRNSIYGKVGALFYDYEMELRSNKTVKEEGTGYMLEAGWAYRWDSGMGMNVGWQYQDASDLKLSALNVGINYAF